MARRAADGCLVPIEPFSELVRDFLRKWNRDRPQPGGQFGKEEASGSPVRALAWLAAASALPETTLENIAFPRRNRDGRLQERIELGVADQIATALDAPYIFTDPRVEGHVVPNRFATRAARAECCSGSELAVA